MNRINGKIKAVWGISEVGFSVMATMETSFFVFFLTDVAQMPLAIVAAITGSSALIDAISAVIAGIVIDKVKFRDCKFRKWLLICPPFVTIFFVLMVTKIGGDMVAGILVTIGYVLSHFIWNICWTANRNLIQVLSDDGEERSFLSSRIAMGSSIGKIIASYGIPLLSGLLLSMLTGVAAYTSIALLGGLLFWICYYIHYFITAGYDTDVDLSKKAVTFADMGKSLVTNPHLIALLIHDALRLMAWYGVAATASYYSKVVLENPGATSMLLVLFYLGTTIGSAFSAKFVKKFGSKKTTIFGVLACAIIMGLGYFLATTEALGYVFMFLCTLFFGVPYGLTSNLYGMCGAYSEWKTGENARGVIMAFCSLGIKIGIAIRGVLITAVLGMIKYDPNATVMTDAAKSSVRFLFFGVMAIAMLISIIPMLLYKLDDKKVEEMEKEITERKKNAA